MMVNIGTRAAKVNIVFSTSRNPAFFERKVLQYTTLSIKLHQCTLREIKTHAYTTSIGLACRRGPETTIKADFLTKSGSNTLQTCMNTKFEYQQA